MKEGWKEGTERVIPLPHDGSEVAELYVHWIYTDRILSRSSATGGGGHEMILLVDAFVLGEKLRDDRFKDAVIDAIMSCAAGHDINEWKRYPLPMEVNRAYRGTPTGSPLRRLIVDLWAVNGHDGWNQEGLNADFQADLIHELLPHRIVPRSYADSHPSKGLTLSCSYHAHGDGGHCYSQHANI